MHRAEDDVIGQFGDILVAAESAGAAQPVTQAEENPCKSPKKNAAQSIYAPICSKKHQKNILCSMPLLSEIMTKFAHNSFQAQTKTTKHRLTSKNLCLAKDKAETVQEELDVHDTA